MNEKKRSAYSEKLRDPRWQRKRLEVMQRDEFTCQYCFDSERTLNVHHNYYKSGAEPWDYPLESLVTVCENCHQDETENRRQEEQLLLYVCRSLGLSSSNLNSLSIALHDLGEFPKFCDYWEYELTWMIRHLRELREVIEPLMAKEATERAQRWQEATSETITNPMTD